MSTRTCWLGSARWSRFGQRVAFEGSVFGLQQRRPRLLSFAASATGHFVLRVPGARGYGKFVLVSGELRGNSLLQLRGGLAATASSVVAGAAVVCGGDCAVIMGGSPRSSSSASFRAVFALAILDHWAEEYCSARRRGWLLYAERSLPRSLLSAGSGWHSSGKAQGRGPRRRRASRPGRGRRLIAQAMLKTVHGVGSSRQWRCSRHRRGMRRLLVPVLFTIAQGQWPPMAVYCEDSWQCRMAKAATADGGACLANVVGSGCYRRCAPLQRRWPLTAAYSEGSGR